MFNRSRRRIKLPLLRVQHAAMEIPSAEASKLLVP
jgi:hypothetical protein